LRALGEPGHRSRSTRFGAALGASALLCAAVCASEWRASADDTPATVARALESPSSLAPFFASLLRTERREATTRISWFGDSNIAFDSITGTLRARLQARFGDAGHGFVLVTRGHLPYGHRGIVMSTRGRWQLSELVRGTRADGRYGYGGVLFIPRAPSASASFGTARSGEVGRTASRFEVLFQKHPQGGALELRAEDGTSATTDTRAPETSDEVAVLEVADGAHTFSLRSGGRGELRVYGVVLERAVPGVVLDSVGLVGARGKRLLAWDAAHLAGQVALRRPQLVVIGFGANEASDTYTGDETYAAETTEVVRRLRAGAPEAACLVLAPPDQAGNPPGGGTARTFPTLPRRVEVQRRVAAAEGCAFWDTFTAMGGAGSMVRWRRIGLGGRDYRHATAAGYERISAMLDDALVAALAEYRADQAARAVDGGSRD
jgi:lysophospholipase L1-like esterase